MLKRKPFCLSDADIAWVQQTLRSMTLEEKVGQLFCVNYREGTQQEVERIHRTMTPGGAMYRTIPLERAIELTNTLRELCRIPPLVAANLEKGGNGIVTEGTLFASPLEVAATDDRDMARQLAAICGREARAVGCNWAFAPIVDIDSNFRNPITNTRTFGSDPERVERMGVSYVKEIQACGLAACVKHFPGDGQDERDQHLVTSVNNLSCEQWNQTYGRVYQACFEAGALTCMVGHIMQPAYARYFNPQIADEEIMPASLSPEIIGGLLRGKLGFNGLVVTDATTMAGMTTAMPRREAVPRTIAIGIDMFLFCRNLEEDYGFMLDGVKQGIITPERLDEAVTRILATKAALGLHRRSEKLDVTQARAIVGCEAHRQAARNCADHAITLVKEQPGVLPITPTRYKRILFYPIEGKGGFSQYRMLDACDKIVDGMRARGFDVTVFQPSAGNEGDLPPTTEIIDQYDLILYVANLATKSNQTSVRIEWAQPMGANCMHYMNDVPTVFVSVENPYHLLDVPRVKTYINTYSANPEALESLLDKLMGVSPFSGCNPVDPFCGKWDTRL